MGNEMPCGNKQIKSVSLKNVNIGAGDREFRSRRLRQIEEILEVRIIPVRNEVVNHDILEKEKLYDQAIQLVRAFDLISDAKVRDDILTMVIAAAQHESQSD